MTIRVDEKNLDGYEQQVDRIIMIVGSRTFENELLAYVLTKELKADCRYLEQIDAQRGEGENGKNSEMLFFDCSGKSPKVLTETINAITVKDHQILVSYNLRPGTGVEQTLLLKGVKGFFYEHEGLALFVRGIRAVLNGEIWLSRRVLIESIRAGPSRREARSIGQEWLTKREMEVLALVATGFQNEEIAGKLFISSNTVKTHLYNIFKKLNVPNRFQAALWASNNFEKIQ